MKLCKKGSPKLNINQASAISGIDKSILKQVFGSKRIDPEKLDVFRIQFNELSKKTGNDKSY